MANKEIPERWNIRITPDRIETAEKVIIKAKDLKVSVASYVMMILKEATKDVDLRKGAGSIESLED